MSDLSGARPAGTLQGPFQPTRFGTGATVIPDPTIDRNTPGYQQIIEAMRNGTPTPPAGPAPTPSTPAAPPATPAPPQLDATQQSAWAILTQTLQSYGFTGNDLQNLTDFVQKELINGTNADQISLDLQNTQEFANRFPAIVQRRQAGLPPISPAEYVSLERSYAQAERGAGIPPSAFGAGHYDQLIASDVSASEYSGRINDGFLAVATADPATIQTFQDYYGITPGHLTAYFLDPTKALPLLKQQAQAALIGGAATRTGFGEPTQAQALHLAQLGITPTQAQTGFADLFHQRQLYGTLPGQSQTALTSDQLLGAEFAGDETTTELLQRRALEQKATFQANEGHAATTTGVGGLGPVVR